METMNHEMPMRHKWGKYWMVKKIIFLVIVVVAFVYWIYGQQIWMSMQVSGYQAVFLSNGQVYFGHLSASGRWLKLTNIYYLHVPQSTQSADQQLQQTQQKPELVKLGNELHGPQDVMYIEKDKVLFWENMKDDSQVVKAITGQK